MNTNAKHIIVGILLVGVGIGGFFLLRHQGLFLTPRPFGTMTPEGIVVVPGTSPIAASGQVVTLLGTPVRLDVDPGSPEAPQQSSPIAIDELPPTSVKLVVTANGFSPSTFNVKTGKAVTIALTSGDTQTHVMMFDDSSLSAVVLGVGQGETRAITFNAPQRKGTYSFRCDVPGHEGRGEVGTMTVY